MSSDTPQARQPDAYNRDLKVSDAAREAPAAVDGLREAVERVIAAMETVDTARRQDIAANRDAPDNINELMVSIISAWIGTLRAALSGATPPAP